MFKMLGALVLCGAVALLGMKLVPVYMQNYKIKKIAEQVVSDPELKSKRDLVKKVEELFRFEDINDLEPKETVTVNRDNLGEWVLGVKYEKRSDLVYNLGVVASFDDQITN